MSIHDLPEHRLTSFWTRTKSDQAAVEQGCYFDFDAANKVREFGKRFIVNHTGEWAGKPFDLVPWQWFDFIAPLYGWKLKDGRRRFSRFGVAIPKKNGKSTLTSMLCLYALVADKEPNAEVYLCSSSKQQAKIVYREAAKFIDASPRLQRLVRAIEYHGQVVSKKDKSFLQILANENKGKHGYNAHFTLFDEFHEQRTLELWNTLRYAGDARRQSIIGWITTAGFDQELPWVAEWDYAKAVLDGSIIDTTFLPVIYEAGPQDDYRDEATWAKANPSLGYTIQIDKMRSDFQEAVNKGGITLKDFRVLKLNQRVLEGSGYISREVWDACKVPGIQVTPGDCYAGLDLASTRDLNALALVSWVGDKLRQEVYFWCPEQVTQKEGSNSELYQKWTDAGWLVRLPGSFIDWDGLAAHVLRILAEKRPKKVLVDPHNASRLITLIMEAGHSVQRFPQNRLNYNEPMRELERLAGAKLLEHQGSPLMSWNIGNVNVSQDASGYVMPDKGPNRLRKIDGVPATLMALAEAIKHVPQQATEFTTW